jgi:hypothetical protein
LVERFLAAGFDLPEDFVLLVDFEVDFDLVDLDLPVDLRDLPDLRSARRRSSSRGRWWFRAHRWSARRDR